MKKIFSFLAALTLMSAFSEHAHAQCTPVGDPSVFGDHVWNVYAWNSGELSDQGTSWNTNYSGYYAETDMDLNTTLRWPSSTSPSTVPEYSGCPVNNDHHSWSAKRQGFTCNYYQINIPSHDDEAQLFINGVKVWEHDGCCDSHTNVWSGFLNDLSTLEYRATEGGGLSYGSIQFLTVTPSITGSSIICDGTASQLTAPAGDSYLWSTGETTQSISVSEAGTYSATITSASCSATTVPKSMSLHTPPSAPTATVNGSNPYDACDGPSQLVVTNPAAYTYHWSNGMNGTVITPLGPGDYTVTATDALGCVSDPSSALTLDEISAPGDPSVFGDHVWNVYAWNSTNWTDHYAGTLVNSNQYFYSLDLWGDHYTPSSNGSYEGCPVGHPFSYSAKRRGFDPGYYKFNTELYHCMAELYVDGQLVWSQDNSYGNSWYNDVARACLDTNSNVEFRVKAYSSEWSYSVLTFGQITNALPYYYTSSICPGYTQTIYAIPGQSYLWSTGETTESVDLTSSGTYNVTVNEGTCEVSGSYTLTVEPIPTPATAAYGTNPYSPCDGVPTLGISNYSYGLTYHWSNGMTGSTMVPEGAGNYTVTATDWLGCISDPSSPLTVTENLSPGDSTVFGDHEWNVYVHSDYFEGSSGYYYFNYIPPSEYYYAGYLTASGLGFNAADHWDGGSNPTMAPGFQGCTRNDDYFHFSAMRKGFDCGIYQIDIPDHNDDAHLYINGVEVWSHTGCCDSHTNVWTGLLNEDSKIEFRVYEFDGLNSGSITFTLLQSYTPVTASISGPTQVCGSTAITLDAGSGFSSYAWSTGSNTQAISVNAGGSYSVKVTDANGCVSTSQTTITALTQSTYYADADADSYGNNNISLVECSQPSGYVLNNTDCNDANGAIHRGASDVCNNIDDNCDGIVDENAITAIITPGGNYSYCSGTTVVLAANSGSGLTYQWIKGSKTIAGATQATYSTNKAGSYKVKVTNSFGCYSFSPVTTLTQVSKPTATITAQGSLDLCGATSVVLQANSGSGYTYQWQKNAANISGATNQTYAATVKGTYKCIVYNSTGCSATSNGLKVTKSCKDDSTEAGLISISPAIYPNPNNGDFTIELTLDENAASAADIQIMNVYGEIVYSNRIEVPDNEIRIAVNLDERLPSGNYFLRIVENTNVHTAQIIVQR